jgi:hypothetical protein
MNAIHHNQDVENFKNADRPERVGIAFFYIGIIEEIHQGEGVKGPDFWEGRIRLKKHKPAYFEYFGDEENKFGSHNHTPALTEGDAKAEHKAAYPEYKPDHGKLPQVNEGDRKELQCTDHL